jgi:regulator of sigma E protease
MIREEAEEQEREAAAEATPPAEGAKSMGEMAHEDMEALYDKGLVTKLLVFTGGVLFNFLTAIVAMAFYLMIGPEIPVPRAAWIGEIAAESELAKAGARRDDFAIGVEGAEIETDEEFLTRIKESIEGGAGADGVALKLRRGEEIVEAALPAPKAGADVQAYLTDIGLIADSRLLFELEPIVGQVMFYKPAWKAGLKTGDRIVAISEDAPEGSRTHRIERFSDMVDVINRNAEKPIELTIERQGADGPIRVSLLPEREKDSEGKEIGLMGIDGTLTERAPGIPFLQAVAEAPSRTTGQLVAIAGGTYKVFHDAFRRRDMGTVKKNVGGPIVIGNLTYNMAKKGFHASLMWFINLNLILAVMNLLPIPILDGGFIVLSCLEAAMRRPVPVRVLTPVFTFFALCFITLFILISYQDVVRILF